jgi:hypothetical protein
MEEGQLLLAWGSYAIAEGIMNAAVFAHGNTNHPYNVHHYLNAPRAVVFAFMLLVYLSGHSLAHTASMALSMMLVFSYWHNGAYYVVRGMIDWDEYNFFSQSTTTTARISLDFIARLWLWVVGMSVVVW